MKALGHYIIIDPIAQQTVQTPGGLELTEKTREDIRYRTARVVSIGDQITIKSLEKGARILYDTAGAHPLDASLVITIQDVVALL